MENDHKTSSSTGSSQPSSEPSSSTGASGSSAPSFRLPAWAKIAILAGVVVLASIGYFTGLQNTKTEAPLVLANESDPEEIASRPTLDDFILTDGNGKQKKLSDFRGHVVILSFWASWCAPCLVELPTFAELEQKYHDLGLRVLAINVDEGDAGLSVAKDFWAKEKLSFPNFFDRQKELAHKFEVDMLPTNFVIDKEGRLAFSSYGANDWSGSQTSEFIENLLSEP